MNKLQNKVVIVTGASIAKYFAAEGAKVVVNYATSKEGADKVVQQLSITISRAFSQPGCSN